MSLLDRRKVSSAGFLLVMSLSIMLTGTYAYNVFTWREYPDFGFIITAATGIHVVADVSDQGRTAGLRPGDVIQKVNGQSYSDIQEARAALHWDLGAANVYTVDRNGRELEITVVAHPKGLSAALVQSGPACLLGICCILSGVLVFLMKPHERVSWIFFLFMNVVGTYVVFLQKVGKIEPPWLEGFEAFSFALVPATFAHLALCFPEESTFLKKHPNLQVVPYVISAVLFWRLLASAHVLADAPPCLRLLTFAYLTVAVLFFLVSCIKRWYGAQSDIVRLRSKVMAIAFGLTISGPLFDLIVGVVAKIPIFSSRNYLLPFFLLFPLSIAYSIVKHNLFDFDTIIRRTYGYIITTGIVGSTYAIFVLATDFIFGRFEIAKSSFFPLLFVLLVVFFFNPVRNRLQKYIDRVFYRLEYDYQETVQKISESLRSLLSLDQVLKTMLDTVSDMMFIESGRLLLLNRKEKVYECLAATMPPPAAWQGGPNGLAASSGTFRPTESEPLDLMTKPAASVENGIVEGGKGRDEKPSPDRLLQVEEPLIKIIAETKKEFSIYDVQEDDAFKDHREECEKIFESMEAILIVPLIYEDELLGLMPLGRKKSGKTYRREDFKLLKTLANQGVVAIKNALLVDDVIEKERMEEELAIARDLQVSMLPAACPVIPAFEIAALSTPAREVGGDFYDFIDMGDGKLGLVIGDVTGKSVSGALVMSASRTIFRMLAEQRMSVSEMMVRANHRIKKDGKSGMFVALLFAVLDANARMLILSSAGQTQPIYFSTENGVASLVETEGDTFPLGILEDVDYQETRMQLTPGDRVVFYTDGIVEAMNPQQEIYGFERLMACVQEASSLSADALLKKVVGDVYTFSNGAAQHDDLTVIALNVAE